MSAKPIRSILMLLGVGLLSAVCGYAQDAASSRSRVRDLDGLSERLSALPASRSRSGREIEYPPISWKDRAPRAAVVRMPDPGRFAASRQQTPPQSSERSVRSKILGGIVGGVGGFFGGLFLGAAIEGDRCNCDDPGFVGGLIGAPIGGVAGGIIGYKFLF